MPKINSLSKKEIEKAKEKIDAFEKSVKDLTLDQVNAAPKEEMEPQIKLSSAELKKSNEIYLEPTRKQYPSPHPKTGVVEKFNENFRAQYEYDKTYVRFIAENHEIIGETIHIWTRPYGGMPAEEWSVPVNKPVWGPRYLAEQIRRKNYHRLVMEDKPTDMTGMGTFYGSMAVKTTKQRLDAHPAPDTQISMNRKVSSF